MRKPKLKWIHIHGRRWFDRINGNTYHSVRIFADGKELCYCPFQYGYGNQWEWTAAAWFQANGYFIDPGMSLWRWCESKGIKLTTECDDVKRKKDL